MSKEPCSIAILLSLICSMHGRQMDGPRSIGFAVKTLANQTKRLIDKNIPEDSLTKITGVQGWIIRYLASVGDERDVFQKDIEKEFNIRRSTVTGVLQLMEKNELIIREPVPYDARLKKLVLTQKAINLHLSIEENVSQLEEQIRHRLTDEDIAAFFRIIDIMLENTK